MVSEIYLTFLTTTAFGLLALLVRVCYKSKCSDIECLCFKVHRNTNEETEMPEPSPSGKEDNLRLENIYRL